MDEKKQNPKGKSSGRKWNRKPRRDRDDYQHEDAQSISFKPGNDFSWWNKVPELIRDSANLACNWIAGQPIDEADINFIPAGVLGIEYMPVYGVSSNPTSPLNVWARNLYLRMFQKYRGISSYEYPDLGIAILAGVEVVRMFATLERIYGVVTRYSKINSNMPYAEAAALGLSATEADWIRGHLSDYRYDLNDLLRRAQRLCVPKDMSILQDQVALCNYEYMDHNNAKAQFILFKSKMFGIYSDTLLSTGGSITFKAPSATLPLIDTTGSSSNMFVFLDTMLNALLGSTSINRIYGDLITWFGEDQMLQFLPLPEDYVITPVHSEEILHKVHNIESLNSSTKIFNAINDSMSSADKTTLQSQSTNSEFILYQFNNDIITKPHICNVAGSTSWHVTTGNWGRLFNNVSVKSMNRVEKNGLIDTYRVEPTVDVIVEGGLFKFNATEVSYTSGGTTTYCGDITSCAFEIITGMALYSMTGAGTVTSSTVSNVTTTIANAKSIAGELSILDWAPLAYVVTSGAYTAIYGDLDTPIPLPQNALAKIHRACVYSGVQTDIHVVNK